MGSGCRRLVGHGYRSATCSCASSNGRRRNSINAVGIGLRQAHTASKVGAGDGESLAHGLSCRCAEAQRSGRNRQCGSCSRRRGLDTDDHLLIDIKVIAAISEGIERAPCVAATAPTEVDVVLVGAAVVTVDVEGVSASIGTHCAEDDRTSCCHLFLNHRSPLAIAIECGSAAVLAGLLDKAGCAGVISEEDEGVADVADTVHAHTATASRAGTIAHALGLSDIVHQRSHSIALCSGVAARIAIKHICPVEGRRSQL